MATNWIDRTVGYFSPQRGLARARAREATRIYEGATDGRRATSWRATRTSANAEAMFALRPLRDRSRDLARNTPHVSRMLDILTAHTVGTGIIPVSATGKDKIDKVVKQLWEDWQDDCDVTGQLDFYSMQALSMRSMVESGEVVIRYIDRQLDGKLAVPFQLQMLEADYIDSYRDGFFANSDTAAIGSGGVIRSRLGVGLGDLAVFKGLWLLRNHPGEVNTIWAAPYVSDFYPAENLIHMFKMLRPQQVRGVPWMAPIMTTARDLADFTDAANVKARIEACFAAFITNDDNSMPLLDQSQDSTLQIADQANPNAMVTTLEPGMMKELRTGQDIKFAQPTSNTQVEPMLFNNLCAMAAGIGCTYDQITGDLRQANYSSLRAGKIDFWKLVAQMQKHVLIRKLCKPVWARFISRAVLAGQLRQIPGGYPVDWVVPAKEMIDPKKDFDATKNAVRAGAMTPQQFVASFGGNWRDDLKDMRDYFDKAHEYGVVLDIDAGLVDQHGRQPSKPGEADPGADEDQTKADLKDEADDDAGRVIPYPFYSRQG